jgi:hypothetical protein
VNSLDPKLKIKPTTVKLQLSSSTFCQTRKAIDWQQLNKETYRQFTPQLQVSVGP